MITFLKVTRGDLHTVTGDHLVPGKKKMVPI